MAEVTSLLDYRASRFSWRQNTAAQRCAGPTCTDLLEAARSATSCFDELVRAAIMLEAATWNAAFLILFNKPLMSEDESHWMFNEN